MQIKCQDVTIEYASVPILSQLTFEIKPGQFVGIIGPNGSGKTSLLKTLAGLLPPAQGGVQVDGRPISQYTPIELAGLLGVVPQNSSRVFAFSVAEAVAMGGYAATKTGLHRSRRDQEAKVAQVLAELDLHKLADRPITTLSGGEWQRVLIARALIQEPQILLLDEVTTHLDIRYKLEILEKVQALHRDSGLTVVAVLHELELAAEFCTHLMLLSAGKIRAFGSPAKVLTSEIIEEVFGVKMDVRLDSDGKLDLKPRRVGIGQKSSKSTKVHVIGGGGSATQLLRKLVAAGFPVTLGAINREDADWEAAVRLGLTLVEEIPFAPLSPRVRQGNRRIMAKADVIIVANLPFGPGNLGNLEDLLVLVRAGKKVILINSTAIKDRDFTGGQGVALWNELVEAGAQLVQSEAEVLPRLAAKE